MLRFLEYSICLQSGVNIYWNDLILVMVHLVQYDRTIVKIISKQKNWFYEDRILLKAMFSIRNQQISVEVDFHLDANKLLRTCCLFKFLSTFVLSTEQAGIEGQSFI